MAFDFKKEYKDLYKPASTPSLVEVGPISFFAVAGQGDPNEPDGEYAQALALLYALSFTVKMSKMDSWQPEGYFDYVVPPLEGLWWSDQGVFQGTGIADKNALRWVSMIRQPDFVTSEVCVWAKDQAAKKKPDLASALNRVRLVRFAEGPCAQVMHLGPYDDEPPTIEKLDAFIVESGKVEDITPMGRENAQGTAVLDALDVQGAIPSVRLHHEIYLSDPRRAKPENLKTVIRHPVR